MERRQNGRGQESREVGRMWKKRKGENSEEEREEEEIVGKDHVEATIVKQW